MPKIVNHQEKRQEILYHCFRLFTTHGYESLTMREIARALEVSTGTLYHYFQSKSKLFEAMFAQLCERHISAVKDRLRRLKGRQERCVALCEFFLETSDELQQTIKLTLDFQRQITVHTRAGKLQPPGLLSQLALAYQSVLEDELELRRSGLSAGIFSFFLGLLLHRELAPKEVNLQEQLDCIQAFLSLDHGST